MCVCICIHTYSIYVYAFKNFTQIRSCILFTFVMCLKAPFVSGHVDSIHFFVMAAQYSVVWLHHSLMKLLSTDEQLDCY